MNPELTHVIEVARPHQLVRGDLVLAGHQLVHRVLVVEVHLHADEGLLALLRQHVVLLGPRQQVGDAALRQAQDALAEEALTDGELRQRFLHLRQDNSGCVTLFEPHGPHRQSKHHF